MEEEEEEENKSRYGHEEEICCTVICRTNGKPKSKQPGISFKMCFESKAIGMKVLIEGDLFRPTTCQEAHPDN